MEQIHVDGSEPCPDRLGPTRLSTGLARVLAEQSGPMREPVKKGLLQLECPSLLRFALACLVASCAAEMRNSGAETEVASQPQPPTEAPPPAPKPAGVKVFNVAPGRFVLEADAPTQVIADGAMDDRGRDG